MSTGTTAIGVDIGGTTVKIALVDLDAQAVVGRDLIETEAHLGPMKTLERAANVIRRLDPTGAAGTVGLTVPGNVDRRRGSVTYAPALGADWVGTNLAECAIVSLADDRRQDRHTSLSASIINDVQAMTIAEHRLGAARNADDVLCVAVGTGVGGGVVIAGRLHTGVDSTAGSIGHLTVEPDGLVCTCGNRGCLEQYASGPAIAHMARTADAEAAALAAREGDPDAVAAFAEAGRYLGIAVANVCTILTPTAVVVGGGVADVGDLLLEPLRTELRRRATVVAMHSTTVVAAALGRFSGAIGAALVGAGALENLSDTTDAPVTTTGDHSQ